jgi:hypothetical protein
MSSYIARLVVQLTNLAPRPLLSSASCAFSYFYSKTKNKKSVKAKVAVAPEAKKQRSLASLQG